jgi:hypothetical protein
VGMTTSSKPRSSIKKPNRKRCSKEFGGSAHYAPSLLVMVVADVR